MKTTRRSFLKIFPISGLAFAINPVKAVQVLCKQFLPLDNTPIAVFDGNMLSIEEYSERYIKPAMTALANKIDADILEAVNSI